MTLVELERLIRRIEEALEGPPDEGVLGRLAADYATVCRAANQRLNQCAAMLGAGDEHQALQLAEAAPPLLEQLTLLAFRRSPNFRALCLAQNYAVPESFEIKAVRQLNEIYAKGIDKDHGLYREYRRAIMVNDDARALAALRSITRLNPNDKNAGTELERIEQKLRADKIHKLEWLVRDKAPAHGIAALAKEVEAIPEAQQSAAWIPAQTIRGAFLIEQAREAQRAGEVEDLQRILSQIPSLAHLLSASDRASVEELQRWSAADAARRKEAASRRAAIVQLTDAVARIEQEQLAPRKQSLLDLRRSADALDRAWRQVETFRAEIAGDISTRAQKLRDTLRLQIERRVQTSRRIAFVAVAAVVLICIAAAWYGYSRQAANSLARKLQTAVANRRVSEAETALANSSNHVTTPLLKFARENALEFVNQQRGLMNSLEGHFAFLEEARAKNFTNETLPRIATIHADLKQKIDRETADADAALPLAPEIREAANARLLSFETAWNQRLERERAASSARGAEMLQPIESAVERELVYTRNPSEVAAAAAALKKQLEAARAIVAPGIEELRPKQEVVFRFENLETRINKFEIDATTWFVAQNRVITATNLASYNTALQLLATNGFTPAASRPAVMNLAAMSLNDQKLLAPLLLSNGPASALAEPRISSVLDEILPAEREIQRRLRDDENIQNVSRLEIEIKTLPADHPRRKRTVFLRGELQRRITRRAGQIYDPIEIPSVLQFATKEMSSLDYSVEEPAATPERELFDRELTNLIDSNTGKYQKSLLQCLDDVNRDRHASPVFRAWLFLQICHMIDAQPVQWSAIWSPSFAADRAALQRLDAQQINSGDWFVPAANARRAAALNAHFDRAGLHSYAREAAFFKRLLPKAAQAGVKVIGYLNSDGEPVINDTRAHTAVYAIVTPNQPPQLIFSSISPSSRPQPITQALPYSPLFVFGGDATELIHSTLQLLGYSAAAVNIPETLPAILRANTP